jgi:hypothetical protein
LHLAPFRRVRSHAGAGKPCPEPAEAAFLGARRRPRARGDERPRTGRAPTNTHGRRVTDALKRRAGRRFRGCCGFPRGGAAMGTKHALSCRRRKAGDGGTFRWSNPSAGPWGWGPAPAVACDPTMEPDARGDHHDGRQGSGLSVVTRARKRPVASPPVGGRAETRCLRRGVAPPLDAAGDRGGRGSDLTDPRRSRPTSLDRGSDRAPRLHRRVRAVG